MYSPSLVMKEMNSLTHSCMLAMNSLEILALSGNAFLITRATDANSQILAIYTRLLCIESRCIEIDCAEVIIVWVRMND